MCDDGNKKVSIIVPVYNVQEYIKNCLDSLLAQTYSDVEIICINDGSTDASGDVCDDYRRKDERVKVHHLKNHGVSYARNYGMSVMEGAWFCFVDSDDWVEPNFVERMYELAIENQCDVVACGVDKTYEYVMGTKDCEEQVFLFRSSKECIHNFICNKNSMQGISCNKLYNASKFMEIKFDTEVKVNEDCLFIYEVMSNCEQACLTTLPLYHWYIRSDSTCHRRAKTADFRAADVFLRLCDKIQNESDEEAIRTLRKNYVSAVVQVLLFAEYERKDEEVLLAKKRCKSWKKDVWNMFHTKQKLKYWYAMYAPRFLRIRNA